jgi:hypothetical protein
LDVTLVLVSGTAAMVGNHKFGYQVGQMTPSFFK